DSPYLPEVHFLKANALLKLGNQDQAQEILEQIPLKFKDSPVALYVVSFFAARLMEEEQYLRAQEKFLWLTRFYPEHRLAWVFHLGIAQASYGLKQTEKAVREYQWMIKTAPHRTEQADAAIRIGDLYPERRDYAQSLAAYFEALKLYPEEARNTPEIYLNRAEAFYWLGQLDQALSEIETFSKKFSGHPEGWRAA